MNDTPAGVMSTTARDMTRLMLALLDDGSVDGGRILRPEPNARMREKLFEAHPSLPAMLYGFYRSDRHGEVIFGHGGDTNQFHSNLALYPEHHLGVFISFNSDPAAAARDSLANAFTDHFFGDGYLPKPPEVVATDLEPYTGDYVPLRSNESTIERLGTLVSAMSVNATGEGYLLTGLNRWVPLGDDLFAGYNRDSRLFFVRDGDSVTHAVVGGPLGTYRKVSGFDSPANQQLMIALMMILAIAAVAGYGYRVLVPSRYVGLPAAHVGAALTHAALVLVLYIIVALTLMGDVAEFVLGVPERFDLMLKLMALNLLLGVVVIALALRQWQLGLGTGPMRVRYLAVVLMALINLWVAWYFNIASYPFSSVPVAG